MNTNPVVARDEPVLIASCPLCDGAELFCIERFLCEEDQADIQRHKAVGYHIISRSVQLASQIHSCECPKQANGYSVQPVMAPPKNAGTSDPSLIRKLAAI